ncbi:MAG: hypothetical protein ACJAVV_003088 [Alphaproteobacteria bacterium]|jgi:hypothetical protein
MCLASKLDMMDHLLNTRVGQLPMQINTKATYRSDNASL